MISSMPLPTGRHALYGSDLKKPKSEEHGVILRPYGVRRKE